MTLISSRIRLWLDQLSQDVRYSIRGLRRAPGYAAVIVATFAFGIGANVATFVVLEQLFLRPPHGVARPEEVRLLWHRTKDDGRDSYRATRLLTEELNVLRAAAAGLAPLAGFSVDCSGEACSDPGGPRVARATTNYFSLLGLQPRRGRFFTATEEQEQTRVALLSEG